MSVSAGTQAPASGHHHRSPLSTSCHSRSGCRRPRQEGQSATLGGGWYLYMAIRGRWAKRSSIHLTCSSSPMEASRMATS